jgi:phosphoenolpyruvate-protein kinase (PTS system EI component)
MIQQKSLMEILRYLNISPRIWLVLLNDVLGVIGRPDCGWMTGHLAIISRTLDIPCVIGCNYDKFSDGQVVFLDSSNGEIRIMLTIDEIKKYLQ